jgi:hypothetical protein
MTQITKAVGSGSWNMLRFQWYANGSDIPRALGNHCEGYPYVKALDLQIFVLQ